MEALIAKFWKLYPCQFQKTETLLSNSMLWKLHPDVSQICETIVFQITFLLFFEALPIFEQMLESSLDFKMVYFDNLIFNLSLNS